VLGLGALIPVFNKKSKDFVDGRQKSSELKSKNSNLLPCSLLHQVEAIPYLKENEIQMQCLLRAVKWLPL